MKFILTVAVALMCSAGFSQTSDTIRIVSYNLLNFPNGRDDCGSSNTVVPNRYDSLRKIMQYTRPDIFVACEVQEKKGADSVLTRSLNVFGQTNYAMANWVSNTSGSNDLQNILFYNTDKLVLLWQDEIVTDVRDINHYVLYALDPNLGNHFDTTFYEVFMCHLKAGSTAQNQQTRLEQVELLRNYIDARPIDRHYFVCGDLNVYKSSEPAYQELTTGGINPLKDPINRPGNWNNNSSFADIHTQSTRSSGNFDCGSTGGMDDRFDQILVSQNVLSGIDSVRYVTDSYAAIGNDANHFNGSINSGSNSLYPDSIVDALFYLSDHLPVYLETVVNYPLTNGLALYPQTTAVTCHGATNGTITVVPNAGQAPYTFQWDAAAGSQTTATAENLGVGAYCVVVTDALGETDDLCVAIGQPSAIAFMPFVTPDYGNCTGEAVVIVSGGVPPYTYSWDDPMAQTSNGATDLCPGTYTCTITDANGCDTTAVFVIESLGMNELAASLPFKVYPNPTNGVLTIRNEGATAWTRGTVMLCTLDGRMVVQEELTSIPAFGSHTLYLDSLENGLYLLLVNGVVQARVELMRQ